MEKALSPLEVSASDAEIVAANTMTRAVNAHLQERNHGPFQVPMLMVEAETPAHIVAQRFRAAGWHVAFDTGLEQMSFRDATPEF